MIDFKKLVKAGVHFGHQASRWVPKMDPYIWGVKNKVHLIDVSKTAFQLEKASQFLEQVASEGKQILWVGTKKAARDIVRHMGDTLNMPYVDYRWVGGTLSNYAQVKKSVTSLLHYEDVLDKSEQYPHYTKKELNTIRKKVERLRTIVGGIKKLAWPIGAVVIVDVNKEQSALKEAHSMGIPVIAMVDTNADPSLVNYVIPANDDAPRSIQVILEYLKEAVDRGIAKKEAAKTADRETDVKAAKSTEKKALKAEKQPAKAIQADDLDDDEDVASDKKDEAEMAPAKPKVKKVLKAAPAMAAKADKKA